MANFPKIDGLCPYLDRLDAIMDGDHCRMCKRTVIDLTDMPDAGRAAFLASCSGPVCVSYRFPIRAASAAAAALAATALGAVPVAAQPAPRQAPPSQAEGDQGAEYIIVTAGRIPGRGEALPVFVLTDHGPKEPQTLTSPLQPPKPEAAPKPAEPASKPAKPAKPAKPVG